MNRPLGLAILMIATAWASAAGQEGLRVRVATFNVSFFRSRAGELTDELATGSSPGAAAIAEVIQRARPDLLLLNEFDYDERGAAADAFCRHYLEQPQNGGSPIRYPHRFAAPVNTGVDSGLDLNGNGKLGEPEDAFGYGRYPGQYGMLVLSRYPIAADRVRTFQKFLWRDMPGALRPVDPGSGLPVDSDRIWQALRLSSKSHWDLSIDVGGRTLHFIVAHPTPPVFDGPEDRNGCRNHDEIRLLADYLSGADYLVDDAGVRGGLEANARLVVAGDLNADPHDGESRERAIGQLLEHPRIEPAPAPRSRGAAQASAVSGGANARHRGDAAEDTGDFDDRGVGNLRVDYVLASRGVRVVARGVWWPAPGEDHAHLAGASDHHLVWVDLDW